MDCLNNIVGLSKNTCDCWPERPENADKSLSGFYLDDPMDGIPLHFANSGAECGDDGLWGLLDKARSAGIIEYVTRLNQHMYEFNLNREPATDIIVGDQKNNSWLTPKGQYAGVRFFPNQKEHPLKACTRGNYKVKGAVFKIERITLHRIDNQPASLHITKNGTPVQGSPFAMTQVGTSDIYEHNFTTPLLVDFFGSHGQTNEWDFYYEHDNIKYRNYKFNCNCTAGVLNYWEHRFTGVGMTGTGGTLTKSPDSAFTAGLRFYGIFTCDAVDFLCNFNRYNTTPWWQVQAKTIQLMSINKLIGQITMTSNINRFTGLSKEALWGRANSNSKKIMNDLQWLAINIPKDLNSCILCKEAGSNRMVSVFV